MGQVFLGVSAGGRPVAVKVIRAELAADQEFRIRFGREVAAARRVSGLFTALVVDADVDGPVPWLATAYVTGPSLSEAVSGHGPMPARLALALAAGLAEGLSAIHAASVVHCDLKPSNVLLSQDGPRVIDFGISRAAEAVSVTGADLVVGSPGFMSPEQAMGEAVGSPSDVFSLGAVLVFAVTGCGPFGEGSGPELAYRLVYHQPSLDLVPAELRPLVGQCLVKDPSQRPTAEEVLAEVGDQQPAAGWLPDLALGAFGEYGAPSLVPPAAARARAVLSGPPSPRPPSPGRDRMSRRHLWRSLAVAGATAVVLAASAVVSLALAGSVKHPFAAQLQPNAAETSSSAAGRGSFAPAAPRTSPSASVYRPAASAAVPAPLPADITPAADTITSPGGTRTSPSTSPSASPSTSASPTPPASPSPSPSTSPAPPVPRITSVGTYQQGAWVYFDVHFTDPGQDAQGFGFTGSNGQRWVEGQYPFSDPHGGIVGPGSIAYPLDLKCGTAGQHTAKVEAWIYDVAGASSQPAVINLACVS